MNLITNVWACEVCKLKPGSKNFYKSQKLDHRTSSQKNLCSKKKKDKKFDFDRCLSETDEGSNVKISILINFSYI